MTFVQLIEAKIDTDTIDAVLAEADRWYEKTEGRRTQLRELITRDRNEPNRFVVIAIFDCYDAAVTNSELPETRRWAARVKSLTTSIGYRDLDVIDERS
jgi:quinol monooxygenase YgiN